MATFNPVARISLMDQIDAGGRADARYHARVVTSHAKQVSSFVKEYGERSASLITETLNGSTTAGPGIAQARMLVASMGTESARALPAFINAYYYLSNVDSRA